MRKIKTRTELSSDCIDTFRFKTWFQTEKFRPKWGQLHRSFNFSENLLEWSSIGRIMMKTKLLHTLKQEKIWILLLFNLKWICPKMKLKPNKTRIPGPKLNLKGAICTLVHYNLTKIIFSFFFTKVSKLALKNIKIMTKTRLKFN